MWFLPACRGARPGFLKLFRGCPEVSRGPLAFSSPEDTALVSSELLCAPPLPFPTCLYTASACATKLAGSDMFAGSSIVLPCNESKLTSQADEKQTRWTRGTAVRRVSNTIVRALEIGEDDRSRRFSKNYPT